MMTERIEEQEIEQLLSNIQPEPGAAFHNRMANAPWKQANTQHVSFWSRKLVSIAAGLLLVMAVFWTASPLHTLAQEIINVFFSPIASETQTDTYVAPVGPTPSAPVTEWQPNSIESVEAQAGFIVKRPTVLPDGYVFDGAQYYADGQAVIHNYFFEPLNGLARNLIIYQYPISADTGFAVGQDTVIETVQIGDLQGEYVVGWWDMVDETIITQNDTEKTVELETTWNANLAFSTLRWQDGNMIYEMMFQAAVNSPEAYQNGGAPDKPGYLDRDMLITIAQGLR